MCNVHLNNDLSTNYNYIKSASFSNPDHIVVKCTFDYLNLFLATFDLFGVRSAFDDRSGIRSAREDRSRV